MEKNIHADSVFNIQIDGVVVDRVHVQKFLGVLVDDELTWNNHITSVCKNISKNMSMLYKVKHILNSKSLLYIVHCCYLIFHMHVKYGVILVDSVLEL